MNAGRSHHCDAECHFLVHKFASIILPRGRAGVGKAKWGALTRLSQKFLPEKGWATSGWKRSSPTPLASCLGRL